MPVVILFSVGPGAAVITTMIYAVPPAIRITALGIRKVPTNTVEAAEAIGSTRLQVLAKVQLPLARRMILLGVNQTILFALSMVVIAGLIGGKGLGDTVTSGLNSYPALALLAGVVIVIVAVAFDRATEAIAARTDPTRKHLTAELTTKLRIATGAAALAIVVAAVLAKVFDAGPVYSDWSKKDWVLARIQSVLDYVQNPSHVRLPHHRADRQLPSPARARAAPRPVRRHAVVRHARRADDPRVRRQRPSRCGDRLRDAEPDRPDRRVGDRDGDALAGRCRDRDGGHPRARARRLGGGEQDGLADPAARQRRPPDAAAARLHHPVHLPDARLDRPGDDRRRALLVPGRRAARRERDPRRRGEHGRGGRLVRRDPGAGAA